MGQGWGRTGTELLWGGVGRDRSGAGWCQQSCDGVESGTMGLWGRRWTRGQRWGTEARAGRRGQEGSAEPPLTRPAASASHRDEAAFGRAAAAALRLPPPGRPGAARGPGRGRGSRHPRRLLHPPVPDLLGVHDQGAAPEAAGGGAAQPGRVWGGTGGTPQPPPDPPSSPPLPRAYLDRANKQLAPLAQELRSNFVGLFSSLLDLGKGEAKP